MLRPLSRLLIIQRNYFHKTAVESLNQLNFIRNGKYLHGCQRRLFSTEVANIGIPEVDKQQINYAELNFDDQTVELIKTYETEVNFQFKFYTEISEQMFYIGSVFADA